MAAALLFALLFQSPAFAALGGSTVLLSIVHPFLAEFLSTFIGGLNGAGEPLRCSGHFPGISYDRLFGASTLRSDAWPSYYTVFLGFIAAYMGALPYIYEPELAASPRRRTTITFAMVAVAVIVLLGGVYRYASGCDTPLGILIGLAVGALFGLVMVLFLAYISDRRVTNILGFPLLRSKAQDGRPIYVCERPPVAA